MTPTILIEHEVYRKVMHWVNKSQYEVSGLGTVRVEKDGVLRVMSAMLLPQENGSTHTDIEAEEVNKALFELRSAEGSLRWWWHSHVDMGVFWSGTDMDTIKKIGSGGWFAASVFNKKEQVKSAYYGAAGQTTPWGVSALFLDDLTTRVVTSSADETAAWDAEYEKNVTNNRFPAVWSGYRQEGYEPNEKGVWVPTTVPLHRRTTGTSGQPGAIYDPAEIPPVKRPSGMPKRVYKSWKREHRELLAEGYAHAKGEPESRFSVDEYGFCQEERLLLAEEGWDTKGIDSMIAAGFTPSQIVMLAENNMDPQEIGEWLRAEYSVDEVMNEVRMQAAEEESLPDDEEDLEDIPVADRRRWMS